jgi:cytoskeletal protein RodZ
MPGLGDEFRAAREARHLSPSDVSEQIHIRSVYLQSIEDEDWSAIAAPVYVRGFIRTYARFLGLDPESAVERFSASLADQGQKPHETVVSPAPRRRPSIWLWLATAAAILLVGFVGYSYYQVQSGEKAIAPAAAVGVSSAAPGPVAVASTPAPAPPVQRPKPAAPGPPAAAPKRTLEVRLTQRSWLLVDVDGTQRLEGIFPAGTRKEFHGKNAVVRAGNAGGVDLKVNGKELGSMGAAGEVTDRSLTLAEE